MKNVFISNTKICYFQKQKVSIFQLPECAMLKKEKASLSNTKTLPSSNTKMCHFQIRKTYRFQIRKLIVFKYNKCGLYVFLNTNVTYFSKHGTPYIYGINSFKHRFLIPKYLSKQVFKFPLTVRAI